MTISPDSMASSSSSRSKKSSSPEREKNAGRRIGLTDFTLVDGNTPAQRVAADSSTLLGLEA
jgi:hypothetical protein